MPGTGGQRNSDPALSGDSWKVIRPGRGKPPPTKELIMYPYSRLAKTFFGGIPEPKPQYLRYLWTAVVILIGAFILFAGVLLLLHP